jgi:hypothetical protein
MLTAVLAVAVAAVLAGPKIPGRDRRVASDAPSQMLPARDAP